MAIATLTNEFHGTEVRVRIPADGVLSDRQARRIAHTLCPFSTCSCLWNGVRGPQEWALDYGQDRLTGADIVRLVRAGG